MKKKTIILLIVVFVLVIVGIGVMVFMNNQPANSQPQLDYVVEYTRQNSAFSNNVSESRRRTYQPYDDEYAYQLYVALAYYEKTTGNELTIPEIQDYLSHEYEEDGEKRIYTNGKHSNIQEYVEWFYMGQVEKEIREYSQSLIHIYSIYRQDNYLDKGIEPPLPNYVELSFEQFDELIKKEADPSYEMQIPVEDAGGGVSSETSGSGE